MRTLIITKQQLKEYVERKRAEKTFYNIVADLHKNSKFLNENVLCSKANMTVIENYKRKNLITPRVFEMLIKNKIITESKDSNSKKKVFLIHGWSGSPEEPMHKWIKKSLEAKNFKVFVPKMPNTDEPEIKSWIEKIKEIAEPIYNENIFIGHSVGCQAILRYFEKLNKNEKITKTILIAPWMHLDKNTIKEEGKNVVKMAKPWVETPIDFEKIKTHCDNFTAIFSDDDSYVPLSNTKIFEKELNAKIVILKNKGHFDSTSKIDELPELLNFIE